MMRLLLLTVAHPRAYGTFLRILRKYVREERRLTLEDAIRKFTSLPAQRMRLGDRGVLKVGMWADVVVFDPAQVRDRATFAVPNQLSEGMRWVLVNGIPVGPGGPAGESRRSDGRPSARVEASCPAIVLKIAAAL